MAYFDKEVSLSEMVQHIYGNTSVLGATNRPNVFVKELKMYIDYLKNEIENFSIDLTSAQTKKWNVYKNNLIEGIAYYEALFSKTSFFEKSKNDIQNQLHFYKTKIKEIEIPELVLA